MFRKSDYFPFIGGVMLFGGLIVVPLLWGQFTDIRYEKALLPSLVSCAVFIYAHDRVGNFSFLRLIMGMVFMYMTVIRTSMKYGRSEKPFFLAGGFLGYIVMMACGWAGILIVRQIRGKEAIEKELEAEQKEIEKQQQDFEAKVATDSAQNTFSEIQVAEKTPFNQFMANTYTKWGKGYLESLSPLFKKEAHDNSFEKFAEAHKQYSEEIETSNSIRAFDEGEYLIALMNKCFLMTSKAVYILVQEPRVFMINDIDTYETKGFLSVSMNLTLKNGETYSCPKIKAVPDEKFLFAVRDGQVSQ